MNTLRHVVHDIRFVDLFLVTISIVIAAGGLLTREISWLLA